MRYNPDRHHLPPFDTDGILLVDKPKTWTSFDVVNAMKWQFNIPKIGHCGTLDPAATGLLVLVLGKFTRLSQTLAGDDKVYEADILLGTETDSADMDGKVTAEKGIEGITEAQVRKVIKGFVGDQMQIPPMTSAVKKEGRKLYELARKGIEIEREARPVTFHTISIDSVELPHVRITVKCSKGTYIRTLASDIGNQLGCGGVLFNLKRTHSGRFSLKDALSVETLKTFTQDQFADHLAQLMVKFAQEA